MKRLFGILFTSVFILIVSCEKEEESETTTESTTTETTTDTTTTVTADTLPKNCDAFVFTWNDVTNPITGKTWMDRNLGARRVATSITDELAYGDLYQWGRSADGHECRYSDTTSVLSSTENPEHDKFILTEYMTTESDNGIWISTQNDNLWQGEDGINNPCPTGYRVPKISEWIEEIKTWASQDAEGSYGSVLKLTKAGSRNYFTGDTEFSMGQSGNYWSSTVNWSSSSGTIYSKFVNLNHCCYYTNPNYRSSGYSIRCIKD